MARSEAEKRAFNCGMIVAAAVCVSAHGQDSVAEEILRSAGLTDRKTAKMAGADPYDLKILGPVFRQMAS